MMQSLGFFLRMTSLTVKLRKSKSKKISQKFAVVFFFYNILGSNLALICLNSQAFEVVIIGKSHRLGRWPINEVKQRIRGFL